MVFGGGTIFALALFAMPMANDAPQLLIINVIGALGSAMSIAPTSAITTIRGRELGMGTLMGVINSGHALGMTAGPLLAGLIFDAIGMDELFYAGGICSTISIIAFMILMRGKRVNDGRS
jgi:MFS family permease